MARPDCLSFGGMDRGLPVELFVELVDHLCVDQDPESLSDFAKDYMSETIRTLVEESNADGNWQLMRQFLLDTFGKRGNFDYIDCLHLLSSLDKKSNEVSLQYLLRVKFCVDKIEALGESSHDVLLKLLYLQGLTMPLDEVERQLVHLMQDVDEQIQVFREHKRSVKQEKTLDSDSIQNQSVDSPVQVKHEVADSPSDPLDGQDVEDFKEELSNDDEDLEHEEDEDEYKPLAWKKKRKKQTKEATPKRGRKATKPPALKKPTGIVSRRNHVYWNSMKDVKW